MNLEKKRFISDVTSALILTNIPALTKGHVLQPAVEWSSSHRDLHSSHSVSIPLPRSCTALLPVLESWLGLRPERCHFLLNDVTFSAQQAPRM